MSSCTGQSRLKLDRFKDIFERENVCEIQQSHEHTADENDSRVDVKDAKKKLDISIGHKNEREGIVVGLSALATEKLDVNVG